MEIPTNLTTYETPLSTIWMDESGILCSVVKQGCVPTLEKIKVVYQIIERIVQNKKVCTLIQMANNYPSSRAMKKYASQQNEKFTKALALITPTKYNVIIANFFVQFHHPSYPVKTFQTESEARQWLIQYL